MKIENYSNGHYIIKDYPTDWIRRRTAGMNYLICAYCEPYLGETVRLDEAVRLAEKFARGYSEVRVIEYASRTAYGV